MTIRHASQRAYENYLRINSIAKAIVATAMLIVPACFTLAAANAENAFLNSDAAADLPDFSYAGYEFGLGDIPSARGEIIQATDFGVIADDGLDDSTALLEALDAAHAVSRPVTLQLPKVRIVISEILPITRSDFILRGRAQARVEPRSIFRALSEISINRRGLKSFGSIFANMKNASANRLAISTSCFPNTLGPVDSFGFKNRKRAPLRIWKNTTQKSRASR
ncbi:MAG: hypothetical protein AAF582_01580 [Pseudomonadota bacterium]